MESQFCVSIMKIRILIVIFLIFIGNNVSAETYNLTPSKYCKTIYVGYYFPELEKVIRLEKNNNTLLRIDDYDPTYRIIKASIWSKNSHGDYVNEENVYLHEKEEFRYFGSNVHVEIYWNIRLRNYLVSISSGSF